MLANLHPSLQKLFSSLPITIVFHREEDGSYWGESPNLKGCYAQGKTLSEVMEEFKYAVFIYFEVPKKYADLQKLRYTTPVQPEFVDPTSFVEDQDPHLASIPQTLVLQPQYV